MENLHLKWFYDWRRFFAIVVTHRSRDTSFPLEDISKTLYRREENKLKIDLKLNLVAASQRHNAMHIVESK